MKKLRLPHIVVAVLLLAAVFLGGYQGQADSAAAGNKATYKSHDAARVKELRAKKVTNKDREAAAKRAAAEAAVGPAAAAAAPPAQGGTPNYFGPEPNWAYSPQPAVNPSTGAITGGIRKFVDALPNLAVAAKDTTTYPGSDYYEIALVQFTQKMHSDLNPTKLRGYVQISTTAVPGAHVALTYPNGAAIKDNAGNAVYAVASPSYLGPAIVATKDRPVRVKFTNYLPLTAAGGDLFLPVDTTEMGAGMGPLGADVTAGNLMNYAQNRATLHLHGGLTPWISDGTPHQWTTPAGEKTDYPKGVSVQNVPDMPDPGPGAITFFYTNQQSARLMFYHDHAYGITRLNVYAGEAAPYLLTDPTETALQGGVLPPAADTIPLVIQDKTFLDATPAVNPVGSTVAKTLINDPTWPFAISPARNDLWYPHVYMPNQNPNDLAGVNAFGRWDYGPWFWPPWTVTNLPITNPDGTVTPNLPDLSMTMEAFHDTPLVNGKAYPTLTVKPKTYRFRILNASNDRMWNLQLYQTSNIVGGIKVTAGGSGYTTPPRVTIARTGADTTGKGATAVANIDTTVGSPTFGQVTSIDLATVGSSYTVAPLVTIAAPASGTTATATASLYTAQTEVGMVPAAPGTDNFPVEWTAQTIGQPGEILDNRWGGVPDPAKIGPSMIQIGTEGGFLPAPVVLKNIPLGWDRDPKSITVGNVKEHTLFLGPAERADVLIDFSAFAGKTIILYNDGQAAIPAADSRLDYYTSDLDQTDTGGSTKTLPGYGPSTRTIMQIKVNATTPAAAYNLAALQAEFATTPGHDGVFKRSEDQIIVPQAAYDSAYNASFPSGTTAYARISSNSLTFTPIGAAAPVTINFKPKAIQELFEDTYGRMSAFLGVEIPNTNGTNQTTIPYGYIDPATEILDATTSGVQIGATGDGTQIWKITHNGVDSHPIHFHLFNVQLINRVDWAGVVKPPEPNELGWKETVRMNPLEDCIVALRPIAPKDPFGVPDSIRPQDPTMPIGSTTGFTNINPDGTPTTPRVTNQLVNFGWEYVWHCHILSHEEMDMMRAMKLNVPRTLATAPVLTGSQGTSAVNLTWTDGTPWNPQTQAPASTLGNPANEVGFRIERATGSGAFSGIGSALANATTFADSALPGSGTYRYRVTAYNAAGDSVSNIMTIDTTVLAPVISAINPASGPISGGTSVVITGTSLTGATAVTFGAVPSTAFTVNSATQITATAPAGAVGPVDVTVTTAGGTSATSAADLYTYLAVPTVTALAPSSGPISGGTSVVITGTSLTGAIAVTFGAVPATAFTVNSATQITATAPAGAVGPVNVTVTTAGGTSATSAADLYTYLLATNRYEETDSRILYTPASPSTAWATFSTASASGGSYARSSTSGAYVVIPFNGQSLDVIATKGTTLSKADFSVDGGPVTTVDLANSVVQYQVKVFSTGTLPAGYHWVKIVRNATDAAGKFISLDRVEVNGSLLAVTKNEQTASQFIYVPNPWATFSTSGPSGGSYARANTAGSQVTIKFNGIRFDWIATVGTTLSKGDVSLDGVAKGTIDLARSAVAYQQDVWNTGFLVPGVHTVVIKWNTTNAAGKYISLDRADVWGALQ